MPFTFVFIFTRFPIFFPPSLPLKKKVYIYIYESYYNTVRLVSWVFCHTNSSYELYSFK